MSRPAGNVICREATVADVPALTRSRARDSEWGPADPRTAAYLEGRHHPQRALAPRVAFVALRGEADVVGYIAGHLTRRFDCDGELQYLWVVSTHRRSGVASRLLYLLAEWFVKHNGRRVCVDVVPENVAARAFYQRHGAVELNPHWLVWQDVGMALAHRVDPRPER